MELQELRKNPPGGQRGIMSAAQVRGTALAYYRLKDLLIQPLTTDTRNNFTGFLRWAEEACRVVTDSSIPARWACEAVGPVLGASVGAAAWMRGEVANPGAALRIFGLAGDRALSPQSAWALIQPYLHEPTLSEQSLTRIRQQAGVRLKLSVAPTAVDVLVEMTRPRGGAFPVQVSHWLSDYFREHSGDDTHFAALYRTTLDDLSSINARGELAQFTGSASISGTPTAEEWESMIHGRVPKSRLEARAGFKVARQFILDYWELWNKKT
jgi:hypothetical protein